VRLINQTVIQGADVRFVCAAAGGRKQIELEWIRNGEPLIFGMKYKDLTDTESDKAFGSILVTKVDQEDNGEYTCVARSDKVEVKTTAILTVLPKPDLPELKVAPIYEKKIRVKDDAAPIFIIPINGES
jgi:Immunoglobulin domain